MNNQTYIISPQNGWILLAILSVIWIVLGIYWGKKAKNMDGFMLAGRNVGLAFGAATAMATWVTSNTTMLAPQFALQTGLWGVIAYSTASFGLFLFAPMAKRIRHLMPSGFTSGDFIRLRYGKITWVIFLIISLFYGFIWLVSMGMAGGKLMNALAGIPYEIGMSVILFVCVTYTLFGGMHAVIGTDFIQSLIIMVGIVIIGIAVISNIDVTTIRAEVIEDKPMLMNILFPIAIMSIFNNMLFGLGEVFHSNVWWSRAFAMRKDVGQKAYNLSAFLWLPIPIAAGFIALSSGSLGLNITSPDMVGPVVASHALGKMGSIVVFAVFFCSLASSIDSLLAATSDLITEDIYKKIFNPKANERTTRKMSIVIIISLGLVAWIFCLPNKSTLAEVLFLAGPLVGSTIWPIATGLFWKKANAKGASLGMLLGSAIGLVSYYTIGWYTASLIGAAVSMITVVICTNLIPENFDWKQLNEKH